MSLAEFDVAGQKVLVVGAGRGIGKGIALAFAEAGADVAIASLTEATVGKVSADQVFYLMSRGLTENEAQNLIVQGFLEVFTKELPMEYAIEFNRLVKLEMEGALG